MNDQLIQAAMRQHQTGNLPEAARIYAQVLQANPRHFQAMYLLGYVHFQKEEYETAEKMIGDALKLNPKSPDAYYNRGCALQKLDRHEEAATCFERALALKPDYTDALFNRGTSLLKLSRGADALRCFDAVLLRTPRDPQAWHNRGDALALLRRLPQAIEAYSRALSLAPPDEKTYIARAGIYVQLKDFEHATFDQEQALKLNSKLEYGRGNLFYSRLMCCDWHGFEEMRREFREEIRSGKDVISPLALILFSESPDEQRTCAQNWTRERYVVDTPPLWAGERYAHDKIRIAYVSQDFRTHAVSWLMAGVFEAHDRDRFETTAIAFGHEDHADGLRNRLKATFDHFIDVDAKTDEEVAALMRELEIDIAVDLMGFTGNCRTKIFGHRPAPVQVNFLGYPGTTGSGFLDYIVADNTVVPEADFSAYGEKVVWLPGCFQPNDRNRRIADTVPTRGREGLPENGFVFCSFNNSSKILPEIFDSWMRIVKAIDGSVLWLPEYNGAEVRNLKREAAFRGVDPSRIVFAQLVRTPEEYLSRMRLADLFLDTFPYNAHTTASDALWVGLPILTFPGTTFAGRVAASLLTAMDLPELIAPTREAFETEAVRLAQSPQLLAQIRSKIGHNRETSSLFDTVRFCRNLEAAYTEMWERAQRGEPPDAFAVPEPTTVGRP